MKLTLVNMAKISYVGGCNDMITTRPVLAQFRRYSTKKNVSNMSISFVGWSKIRIAMSKSS